MSDFGEEYTHVPLQCDSISAISVAKNTTRNYLIRDVTILSRIK
jgi:hypothetical protein